MAGQEQRAGHPGGEEKQLVLQVQLKADTEAEQKLEVLWDEDRPLFMSLTWSMVTWDAASSSTEIVNGPVHAVGVSTGARATSNVSGVPDRPAVALPPTGLGQVCIP